MHLRKRHQIGQENDNGNETFKELEYSKLDGFVPKATRVELVKPGDVEAPKADRQMDEDNGRGKVRDSLADKRIVINTNVCDILHHGAYTSMEAVTLGLIDGTCSHSDIYEKIMPNVLQLDEQKISYLYFHRYFQRIYKAKLSKGMPAISNPNNPPRSLLSYIKDSTVKIAYIGATNGAIIDGESTKDKIGSITLWFVLFYNTQTTCHCLKLAH